MFLCVFCVLYFFSCVFSVFWFFCVFCILWFFLYFVYFLIFLDFRFFLLLLVWDPDWVEPYWLSMACNKCTCGAGAQYLLICSSKGYLRAVLMWASRLDDTASRSRCPSTGRRIRARRKTLSVAISCIHDSKTGWNSPSYLVDPARSPFSICTTSGSLKCPLRLAKLSEASEPTWRFGQASMAVSVACRVFWPVAVIALLMLLKGLAETARMIVETIVRWARW